MPRPTDDIPLPPSPNDPTPDPVPDSVSNTLRLWLTVGFAVGYFVILVLLLVYWLSFNHPNLESPCLIGVGIFAAAAQGIVSHFVSVQTHTSGVIRGFNLSRGRGG